MTRYRKFLDRLNMALLICTGIVILTALYAAFIEPYWLRIRHLKLSDAPSLRLIHITDIHYKGDRKFMERIVRIINGIDADAVCLTGDIIEDEKFAGEAAELISGINKPLYGIPGNHDQWALRSYAPLEKMCRDTGGKWILDDCAMPTDKNAIFVSKASGIRYSTDPAHKHHDKRILLLHYPEDAAKMEDGPFDLILAGHTHGGQINIPLISKYLFPPEFLEHGIGLKKTPAGQLHINPGIGTFFINARFMCRPEITVIEI